MEVAPAQNEDEIRAAEVIGSLCLATDLAMGLPFENGLQSTLLAMHLADELGLDADERVETYYGCLLFYAGCTADAEVSAALFPPGALLEHFTPVIFGSPGEIARAVMRALADPARSPAVQRVQGAVRLPRALRGHTSHLVAMCEVAEMLADRVGTPTDVKRLFRNVTDRWDGKGSAVSGAEIPIAVRVLQVARDACFQRVLGGPEYALRVAQDRAGHAFDPAVVAKLTAAALAEPHGSVWPELLSAEPGPCRMLQGAAIDDALSAAGDFADLVSSYFTGHSSAVAHLAGDAATRMGLSSQVVTTVRRAGFVHDLGRVAVETHVWNKQGALTADEWERVRLHAHHSERVLAPSSGLAGVGAVVGRHHERLDGSGYHRGLAAPNLDGAARILAAADVFRTAVEARPHRPARSPEEATELLTRSAAEGHLDPDAVAAVLVSAGQSAARMMRPAGLTDREVQVVALLAGGLQTKQIGHRLGISVKTADRHIQNAYSKMGVSSRSGATLYAMEHGLDVWGELPISRPGGDA